MVVNAGQFSKIQRRLEATMVRLYGKMLRIIWMEHVKKEEVLKKIGTKDTFILTIKEKLEISGIHNEERWILEFNPHNI